MQRHATSYNLVYLSCIIICILVSVCHLETPKIHENEGTDGTYKWPWRVIYDEKFNIPINCRVYNYIQDVQLSEQSQGNTYKNLSSIFSTILEIRSDYDPTSQHVIDVLAFVAGIFDSLTDNANLQPLFVAQRIASKYLEDEREITVHYILLKYGGEVERVCAFLQTLQDHIQQPRDILVRDAQLDSQEWKAITIIMAGAGPVGLMSAIEAYSQGANPELFEKRLGYTRNTWFDLEPPPWSTTKIKLNQWGIQYQTLERVLHSEEDDKNAKQTITMRTMTLEKFLSKVAFILGIKIHFGFKFVAVCNNETALFMQTTGNASDIETACGKAIGDTVVKKEFDVLLGGEGTQSAVRQAAHIDWQAQHQFEFQPFKFTHELTRAKVARSLVVPDIMQVSALVNFKSKNGECPRLNQEANRVRLEPRYTTFVIPGVISVWKRFYSGSACQLQLLFNNTIGKQVTDQYSSHDITDDSAYPWSYIEQVVQLLFDEPATSLAALKEMILLRNHSQLGRAVYSIEVLPVKIYRASATLKTISTNQNRVKILAIAGDASVTAHFRLGVGINNAFLGLNEFSVMIRKLTKLGANKLTSEHAEPLTAIMEEKEGSSSERLQRLVQFQLSTMYYESYCDLVLYFDHTKENYWQSQLLYKPNRKKNKFLPVIDSQLQECYEKAINDHN